MQERITSMTTLELRRVAPFNTLFPIKENVLKKIMDDMKVNGYDCAHPIIVWAGNRCKVIDGNTRLEAALKVGMSTIPIVLKNFKTEEEALQYAIKSQSNRRNLTDSELLACLAELDKRNERGGSVPKASREALKQGKSADATAELLGVSRAKVERLRAVSDYAPEDVKDAVVAGKMSVNKAYNQTMEQRRQDADPAPVEPLEDVKVNRKEIIVKSINGMLQKRLEREVQEYPGIRYSPDELTTLGSRICELVTEHVNSLPQATDNQEIEGESTHESA